jgi:hypothetical protein
MITDDEQVGNCKKRNKGMFVVYIKVGLIFRQSFGDTEENVVRSNFKYLIEKSGL